MVLVVVWHGTPEQAQLLISILTEKCTCSFTHGQKTLCAGHVALVHDQRFADGLLFGQAMRDRFIQQEWNLTSAHSDNAA